MVSRKRQAAFAVVAACLATNDVVAFAPSSSAFLQVARAASSTWTTGPLEVQSQQQYFDPLNLTTEVGDQLIPVKPTVIDRQIGVADDLVQVLQADQQGDGKLDLWAARSLLLLVAAIWGTNFASVKYLENLCFDPPCHHTPSEAALARFGVAAIVSLPLLFKQRLDVIGAGVLCGLAISLGYATQAMALATISSGKCAFICSLTVVFVPLAAAIFGGKSVKPMNMIAAALAMSGVGVLEGMIDIHNLLGIKAAVAETGNAVAASLPAVASSSVETAKSVAVGPLLTVAKTLGVSKGDIVALGQPVGFGSAFLLIEHFQEKFESVPNRVLTIAAAQCVAVGWLSLFWVLHDYHWTMPDFSYMLEPHRLVTIGWTGIVTTVAAIFLEGIALQTASATDASIAFSSEPVWASMFGFWILHEQLSMNSYVGGAIIMSACLLGALSDLNAAEEGEPTEQLAEYDP